jgi:antitoxin (DNA-binding transcriptional repressor) of toxin-antitoxin stability system
MNEMPVEQAQTAFSDIVARVLKHQDRVVLTRDGQRVGAIVPLEQLEMLERIEDKFDLAELRGALAKDGEPDVRWEDVKARLEL